ncbi:uncharacterized protein ACRADG_002104 [Cochliomyia hominivorax]
MKCISLILIAYICFANARQIRYSRYNTELIEDIVKNDNSTNISDNNSLDDDSEVEATVREIKLAPYPASAFRPSREFSLPNERVGRNGQSDTEAPLIDEPLDTTNTYAIDLTRTTALYDSETTTVINNNDDLNGVDINKVENGEDELSELEKPKAPYAPAGFQPKIPFLLPTESLLTKLQKHHDDKSGITNTTEITKISDERDESAPYPAAGYRPSKAFLLPFEQMLLEEENKTYNSNHPVCGSSTNPLAPKPLDGEKENPDSEPINFDGQTKHKSQQLLIPVRFSVHPLLLTRPLVLSAPIPPKPPVL